MKARAGAVTLFVSVLSAAFGAAFFSSASDQRTDEEPIIRYDVRPDPGRGLVEVRATVRLDDHWHYLKDFHQGAGIRWFVEGREVEVKAERIRDIMVYTGLPREGEAEVVYSLKVVGEPKPGYRKRLMGGSNFLLVREGLFLGKDQGETAAVDVRWTLPPGWTLLAGREGIQPFVETQKRLWIAGEARAVSEEMVDGRVLRCGLLAGAAGVDEAGLKRTVSAVFRHGLDRLGSLPGTEFAVVVVPKGTIGGGTALGCDLVSEESLPTIVHEMLHWWTNHSVPTWFREGVHSYVSVKLMAELGLLSVEEFRKAMQEFYLEHGRVVKREGGVLALRESARNYDLGKGGGDMYGAMPLLAFKLDREIQTFNPRTGLADVFAEVCRRRPRSQDILALIKEMTGYDPGPLFRKYFDEPIADAGELLR